MNIHPDPHFGINKTNEKVELTTVEIIEKKATKKCNDNLLE